MAYPKPLTKTIAITTTTCEADGCYHVINPGDTCYVNIEAGSITWVRCEDCTDYCSRCQAVHDADDIMYDYADESVCDACLDASFASIPAPPAKIRA